MDKLRQQILKDASQKYYSTGTSPLTDAEFDKLLEEELQENPDSPLLNVGHGYEIDKDPRAKNKIPHKYGIVGSLDKCHNWSEVPKSFKPEFEGYASLKLDGISSVLYYIKGELEMALTRGQDGIGIDITEKVKKIAPSYISIPDKQFTGAVRGEILMSCANFDMYKTMHPEAPNARNSTAGLMGRLDVSEELTYLNLIVYTVIGHEPGKGSIDIVHDRLTGKSIEISTNYMIQFMWLSDNFGQNNVVPFTKIVINETNFIETMELLRSKWYGKYPADGIVLTRNRIQSLGFSRVYNSVAFKFPAEVKKTTITGIEWNLSKTKYLIPTLLVEPVELSGATVSRCAGCNAKMVAESGWGIGAEVAMQRSGEVIPTVDTTIKRVPAELPTTCPCCNSEVVWDGVHLKCPNPNCDDLKVKDLLVWCNNIAPIDGLGDTLKIKFFEELRDKYNFDISVEGLYHFDIALPQTDSAQKHLFYQMINKAKLDKVTIISALKAINIPRLGESSAEKLANYPEDLKKLMSGEIPDALASKVGEANSKSFIEHIDKFKRLRFIKNNLVFDNKSSNNDRIKVAVTGSLSIPRKQFEKVLEEHGFVLGDITKDTKYLIANEVSESSKFKKAQKLGIEIISEAKFRNTFSVD